MAKKPIPLAQIIHISDLHICQGYSDRAELERQRRLGRLAFGGLRLKARDWIQKFDLLGWSDGTLDHDADAQGAFGKYLIKLENEAPEWFSDGEYPMPSTWLLDTGDLTTFGDRPSMTYGQ